MLSQSSPVLTAARLIKFISTVAAAWIGVQPGHTGTLMGVTAYQFRL